MKISFILIAILITLLWSNLRSQEKNIDAHVPPVYSNAQFKYTIDFPSIFSIDDSVPELVVISKPDARLRINSGCYGFGVEGLVQSVETVQISGIPALKESYYSDSILRLISYSLNVKENCFALELSATSRDGWQDLEKLVKSFRLN